VSSQNGVVPWLLFQRKTVRLEFVPLVDEIFAKLRGVQFFTALDAVAGFLQIPTPNGR
jgi:hypothetical protein